jgi:hypothetical protein
VGSDCSSSIRFARSDLLCGEKSGDLTHHALCLVGLKQKLSMCGAIENNQLLWFWSFLELRLNPRETGAGPTRIVSGYDEQAGGLEPGRVAIRRGAEEHYPIDLALRRCQ